jgi:Tfp pilus assembly protein PilF
MRRTAIVCGLIAIATGVVYAQLASHAFLDLDDGLYVTGNQHVREGLSLDNVVWALVSTDAYIWHPITWLSYLVDSELYGIESAGPWLLTNVAWHVATALALLGALVSLTGRFWPSAFVAALFALHPIQAEPVSWVSGRKEILSGFFFSVTLWLYARYARRRDGWSYAALMGSTVLCLAAKGSQVSLPFLLLLLDYWPLGRLRLSRGGCGGLGSEGATALVVEKLPLLALSLATIAYQLPLVSSTYSPWIVDPSFVQRVFDGIMATVATLGRLFWPVGLAIVYPTPAQMGLPPIGAASAGAAFAALAGVTVLAAAAGQRRGYLVVGWLWFLGMLLPTLGLLPWGLRVMNDRYSYVPMIGLAVAISFGAADGVARYRLPRAVPIAAAVAVATLCAVLSWNQAGVWRDSLTLFDHALAVTERNAIVHFFKGNTLAARGDLDGAQREYESALAIYPRHPDANENLGRVYLERGRGDLAVPCFERALEARPGWLPAMTDLGNALLASGERERAIAIFEAAVAASPGSADAHYWLAAAQQASGHRAEAEAGYREALRIDPNHEWALRGLARLRESPK